MTFHISGGHLCTAFCMSLELSVNGILHQVPRGGRVEDLTLGSSPTLMKGIHIQMGFPGGSDGKASACNAGDLGLIPGLGRPPGEGNGNPLQYSCLENSMDGGSLQSKGLSRVFSNTTVQKHQFFSAQPSSQSNSHIRT